MKKIAIGVIIILAGIFMFTFNIGLLPYMFKPIIFSWQMLLIVIGFCMLFDKKQNNIVAGVLLMAVGGAFLCSKLFYPFFSPDVFWPLMLIAGGILFVILSMRKGKRTIYSHSYERNEKTDFNSAPFTGTHTDDRDLIMQRFVFSGSKEIFSSNDFKGAEVDAVFSGIELDFTQCRLAPDSGYIPIKITSIFSGVILYLPLDWDIQVHKTGVMGDFVDKRPKRFIEPDEKKKVVLELNGILGGGEIRYYE